MIRTVVPSVARLCGSPVLEDSVFFLKGSAAGDVESTYECVIVGEGGDIDFVMGCEVDHHGELVGSELGGRGLLAGDLLLGLEVWLRVVGWVGIFEWRGR